MDPNYWTLIGVAMVVAGFVARLNPLLVVLLAVLATGIAAVSADGLEMQEIVPALIQTLGALGKAFNDNRFIALIWLVLPVIGLLEREGLQERARMLVARARAATTGRVLLLYFVLRQATAAIGLTSLGGHAQMVRPLVAPMAEGAAENRYRALPDRTRFLIRAHSAAADNVGVFFGEDIFIAFASILLIKGFLEQAGYNVEPFQLSVWAIPTAICALLVHGTRMLLLDRRIKREATAEEAAP